MAISTDLKQLRLQVEKLQVEVDGRQRIGSYMIWDEQNESSVNQETSRKQEEFSGLIVHLTPEMSPPNETVEMDQNEFEKMKATILGELDQSRPRVIDRAARRFNS